MSTYLDRAYKLSEEIEDEIKNLTRNNDDVLDGSFPSKKYLQNRLPYDELDWLYNEADIYEEDFEQHTFWEILIAIITNFTKDFEEEFYNDLDWGKAGKTNNPIDKIVNFVDIIDDSLNEWVNNFRIVKSLIHHLISIIEEQK